MTRISSILAFLFLTMSGVAVGQGLSPIDINQRLVVKYGSDLKRFTPLPGTTLAGVASSSTVGLLDALNPGRFVLVWGSESICEIDASSRDLVNINAANLTSIVDPLHNIGPGDRCKGVLFLGADSVPHVFLRFSPQVRTGAWISNSAAVPATHMPEAGFPETIARALMSMPSLPVRLVTAAPDRAAYVAEDKTVHILAFGPTGGEPVDLAVCAEALSFPILDKLQLMRITTLEDLAFHAVHFRGQVDLLAYITCI